jgi:hypothetical protein
MVTYKKLLGQPVGLTDLAELQPDIHRWGMLLLSCFYPCFVVLVVIWCWDSQWDWPTWQSCSPTFTGGAKKAFRRGGLLLLYF